MPQQYDAKYKPHGQCEQRKCKYNLIVHDMDLEYKEPFTIYI